MNAYIFISTNFIDQEKGLDNRVGLSYSDTVHYTIKINIKYIDG